MCTCNTLALGVICLVPVGSLFGAFVRVEFDHPGDCDHLLADPVFYADGPGDGHYRTCCASHFEVILELIVKLFVKLSSKKIVSVELAILSK